MANPMVTYIYLKTNQDTLLDSFYGFDLNKEPNVKLGYESKPVE